MESFIPVHTHKTVVHSLRVNKRSLRTFTPTLTKFWTSSSQRKSCIWQLMASPLVQNKISNDHVVSVRQKMLRSQSSESKKSNGAGRIRLNSMRLSGKLVGTSILMSSPQALNSCIDYQSLLSHTYLSDRTRIRFGKELQLFSQMHLSRVRANIKYSISYDRNALNQVSIQILVIVFTGLTRTWLCWAWQRMSHISTF